MKNIIVSKFTNFKSKIPENVTLWDWFNDDTYKSDVENIRNTENKEDRTRMKANLPAITVSGVFSVRSASGLIKHSGFMCIDIDSGGNPGITDFALLRNELKNINNIAYVSLSVSGKGVFGLIPIQFPDKHKEHFEALKICFEKLGIVLDKACSDVSRLRAYSYDENAYWNENATVFNRTLDFKISKQKTKSTVTHEITHNTFNSIKNNPKFNQVMAKILNLKKDLTEDYDDWFGLCCALVNEFGEEGRESFHLLSSLNIKYSEFEANNLFNQCFVNNYKYTGVARKFTIGTFFHLAKKYGIV